MDSSKRQINPVHFKPLWTLVREGSETPIQFSDCELIVLRVMATTVIRVGPGAGISERMIEVLRVVEERIKTSLDRELENNGE